MKHTNRNHIDLAIDTMIMALATMEKVNGEKDIPFWIGLTDGEKHGKRFAQERARFYMRNADRRREFKAFYLRLCGDVDYRNGIKPCLPPSSPTA